MVARFVNIHVLLLAHLSCRFRSLAQVPPPYNSQAKLGYAEEFTIGGFLPVSGDYRWLTAMVLADLDFRKNFEPALQNRFGPPILPMSNIHPRLRVRPLLGNDASVETLGMYAARLFMEGEMGLPSVNSLVGTLSSTVCTTISGASTPIRMIQIGTGALSDELSNKGRYPYFFRISPTSRATAGMVVTFVNQYGFRALVVLATTDAFAKAEYENIETIMKSQGTFQRLTGAILTYGAQVDQTEWSAAVQTIHNQRIKLVGLSISSAMAIEVGRLLVRDNLTAAQGYVLFATPGFGSQSNWAGLNGMHLILQYVRQDQELTKYMTMLAKMTAGDILNHTDRYALWAWPPPVQFVPASVSQAFAAGPFNPSAITGTVSLMYFNAYYVYLRAFNSLLHQGLQPNQIKGSALKNELQRFNMTGVGMDVNFTAVQDNNAVGIFIAITAITGAAFTSYTTYAMTPSFLSIQLLGPAPWPDGSVSTSAPIALKGCQPGFRLGSQAPGFCQTCPPGQFTNGYDQTECTRCSRGSYADPTGTGCILCLPGKYANENGAESCKDCTPGTFAATVNTSTCSVCPTGSWTNSIAATSCRPCNAQDRMAGYSPCLCQHGSFMLASDNSVCRTCPDGMTCPLGSVEHTVQLGVGNVYPTLKELYWSSSTNSLSVFRCANADRCPAGRAPGKCGDPNLEGQACVHCKDGFIWTGKTCEECASIEKTVLIFPILPVLCILAIVVPLYRISRDPVAKWGSWQNGMSALLFITLNHYQIVVILRNSNLVLPASSRNVQETFEWSSDLSSFFKPPCLGYADFKSMLIIKSLAPIAVAVAFAIIWATSQACSKFAMKLDITINCFFACLFTFFAGIAEMGMVIFKCGSNPNDKHTLVADRSINCYEGDWYDMMVVGIAATVCWCLGFGCMMLMKVIQAPAKFHLPSMQMRWKFLFIKYSPHVHWWSLIIILKAIILNIGYIFLVSGVAQVYWVMCVLLLYTSLTVGFQPWRHLSAWFLDVAAHFCLILICTPMIWFARASVVDVDAMNEDMDTLLSLLTLVILPLAVVASLHLIYIKKSARLMKLRQKEVSEAAILCSKLPDVGGDEFIKTLLSLPDQDFSTIVTATSILTTELFHRKTRSFRITEHEVTSLASMSAHPTIVSSRPADAEPDDNTDVNVPDIKETKLVEGSTLRERGNDGTQNEMIESLMEMLSLDIARMCPTKLETPHFSEDTPALSPSALRTPAGLKGNTPRVPFSPHASSMSPTRPVTPKLVSK